MSSVWDDDWCQLGFERFLNTRAYKNVTTDHHDSDVARFARLDLGSRDVDVIREQSISQGYTTFIEPSGALVRAISLGEVLEPVDLRFVSSDEREEEEEEEEQEVEDEQEVEEEEEEEEVEEEEEEEDVDVVDEEDDEADAEEEEDDEEVEDSDSDDSGESVSDDNSDSDSDGSSDNEVYRGIADNIDEASEDEQSFDYRASQQTTREPRLEFRMELEDYYPDYTNEDFERIDEIRHRYLDSNIHDASLRQKLLQAEGPLIDPLNEDYNNFCDDDNISQCLMKQPGEKFSQHYDLQFLGASDLGRHSSSEYKNNLTVVIDQYFVVAVSSSILVYELDSLSNIPGPQPVLRFDTRPRYTSASERLISTWPSYPHDINFMKVGRWLGSKALALCEDDGSILIYYWDTIVSNLKYGVASAPLKIYPDFKLKLEASVWGVDFMDYTVDGTRYNLIIGADNSQHVTLFLYSEFDQRFYHRKSPPLMHNVPCVSFVSHEHIEFTHLIKVSCVSVAGELVVFGFKFDVQIGPENKPESAEIYGNNPVNTYYVDPNMDHVDNGTPISRSRPHRYLFESPNVISLTLLKDNVWTVHPCDGKYFMPVNSIAEMTGGLDFPFRSAVKDLTNKIIKESLAFGRFRDDDYSLGIAAKFQFFKCLVFPKPPIREPFKSLVSELDQYKRIYKMIKAIRADCLHGIWREQAGLAPRRPVGERRFFLVSTAKKAGVFNEFLLANCHSDEVFAGLKQAPVQERATNRMSIAHVIPEISAFITVSQQLGVSVFRLTSHRGMYGMRQELVFPSSRALQTGRLQYSSVIGFAVKNITSTPQSPRYLLYITYNDGTVLTYQLSNTYVDI